MQGLYFASTLHALSLCVMSLFGSELAGDERVQLNARHAGHLKTMWEANGSCSTAGYPEGSVAELNQTWGDCSTCSGLPSLMDVPTESQAAARESAAEMLHSLRQLAGRVWPSKPADDGDSIGDPSSYAEWEVLQAELLASAPSELLASLPSEGPPSQRGLRHQRGLHHPHRQEGLPLMLVPGAKPCGASTPPAPTCRGPASWRSRRARAAGAAGCGTAAPSARRRAGGMGTG